MQLSEQSRNSKSLSVPEHVQHVLQKLILNFKDPKNAQRILSKKIGIHEKTFLRLLKLENKPTAPTVLKIYKTYFNKFNDAEVLDLVPAEIAEFLKTNLVLNYKQTPESSFSEKVDVEIQNNPIFAEIYVLAGTGPIHFDEIQHRYGLFGVELLKQMLQKNILKEVHTKVYALGENQASFVDHTVLKTGLLLAKNYSHVSTGQELDQNYISFFAEGLTQEAYQQWIKIDQDAFQKKVQLTQNSKNLGSVRAFSFQVIETLEIKDKNGDKENL